MSLRKLLKSHTGSGSSDLLVTPRYEKYLATHPNLLVDDEVGEFVKQELVTPQRDRSNTFSASARGACPREQVFAFTPLEPVMKADSQLYSYFHQGVFMHLKWQVILMDAGILDDVEVPCEIEEYRLTGTVDGTGLVPDDHGLREDHERFGWELKSINSRGFSWVLNKGPNFSHLLQTHAYMLGTGWKVWSIVYENKDNQTWKEFVVTYDEKIGEQVIEELEHLNTYVDESLLPPILDECKKRQGAYKKCPYAHVCLEQDSWPEKRQRRIKVKR